MCLPPPSLKRSTPSRVPIDHHNAGQLKRSSSDCGSLGKSRFDGRRRAGHEICRASFLLKHLPELQRLVCSRSSKHLSIWRQGRVKDARLVGGDFDVLDERGIAPDGETVVGEAGGRDKLLVRQAPPKRGDLTARIDAVDPRTGSGVPEVDSTLR